MAGGHGGPPLQKHSHSSISLDVFVGVAPRGHPMVSFFVQKPFRRCFRPITKLVLFPCSVITDSQVRFQLYYEFSSGIFHFKKCYPLRLVNGNSRTKTVWEATQVIPGEPDFEPAPNLPVSTERYEEKSKP